MEFVFKKIAIIGTHCNPAVAETVNHLFFALKAMSVDIFPESATAISLNGKTTKGYTLLEIVKNCDVAIVVGGDGNFLHAARNLSFLTNLPIIGINRGKLGFLTDVRPDQIETRLFDVLKGKYRKEQRFMLQATVKGTSKEIKNPIALNDIVIASGQQSKLFQMYIHIDGKYAFAQRADGIIIATPTGSTAHALSAGGPIMSPELNTIVLVPMFSHSLNSRPIVLKADSKIDILIDGYNNPQPNISFDGHTKLKLEPHDTLHIEQCQKSVTILHPLDYDYFHSLRSKLHWGKMLFP